jgi:hypothetical protein
MTIDEKTTAGLRFRFFLWNDMHVRGAHSRQPRCSFINDRAGWAVECARGLHGFTPPEFIVSAGDIIEGEGENEDRRRDFEYMKTQVIAPIGLPFLPCVGNHENGDGEGEADKNEPYDHFFGPQWHQYIYTRGGIGFIVVDTSGAQRVSDAVTAARNAFLERGLAKLQGMPVMIVTHAPLIAMREAAVLKESFGFPHWKVQDPGLLEIVERNSERVIAVLGGHLHITCVREQKGIYHIVPAGTYGYPSDFASFDVYGDRIEVQMHAVPEPWLSHDCDIHGRPRHKINFNDDEHPDHESYLWGNPSERELVIPLLGLKLPVNQGDMRLTIYHEMGENQWDPYGL